MQTVLLGSSGSAIVEFIIPEAGSYVMVDHHFANASQGAIGVIDAGGKPEDGIEHHNVPATATPTDPEAVQGKLDRSEEHTSELQSLMRISYAVFCLKNKQNDHQHTHHHLNRNSQQL